MNTIKASGIEAPFTAKEMRKLRHKLRRHAIHMERCADTALGPKADELGAMASHLYRTCEALAAFAGLLPEESTSL